MLLLLTLLACASKDDPVNTFDDTGGTVVCVNPVATIVAPESGATYAVGDTVTLTGAFTSAVETDPVSMSPVWAVDGQVIGTGIDESWVADSAGSHLIQLQLSDSCGSAQTSVSITVTKAGG